MNSHVLRLILLFTAINAYAESCTTFSTTAVVKEIRELGNTKYLEKRITYELKSSRGLLRDLTKAVKKQRLRVRRALLHEHSTSASLSAAYRELAKLEERLLLAKQTQLTRLRLLLSATERRRLSQSIREYY